MAKSYINYGESAIGSKYDDDLFHLIYDAAIKAFAGVAISPKVWFSRLTVIFGNSFFCIATDDRTLFTDRQEAMDSISRFETEKKTSCYIATVTPFEEITPDFNPDENSFDYIEYGNKTDVYVEAVNFNYREDGEPPRYTNRFLRKAFIQSFSHALYGAKNLCASIIQE